MIAKLLGVIDLLAALSIILLKFNLGTSFALIIAIVLLIKSLLFIFNIVSIIDIISVVFIFLAIFGIFTVVTWIAFFWLLQKAVFSLLS
ncbi:MAG: hypothetical protein ISS82_03220 [Nanoarchaeota archaeon]|nr:hypothetical protein [Nanoarchaeota archaeon]